MLIIGQAEYEEIRRHGEETYPYECCGVMLGVIDGDTRTVKSTIRCGNTRDDRPQDRFNIDPKELIAAMKRARNEGVDIIGFYHSHPDCPAQASATDLAEAHYLGNSYVITRVDNRVAQETNSFALRGTVEEDKHFEPEEVRVEAAVAR
jgi:proteasome lid subunit RPN8/RPN11